MVRQAHHDNCIPLLNNKSSKNRKFLPPVTQQLEDDEMFLSGCLSRLMRGVGPPTKHYRGVESLQRDVSKPTSTKPTSKQLLQLKPHLLHHIRTAADK